jgi:hypothetical protein
LAGSCNHLGLLVIRRWFPLGAADVVVVDLRDNEACALAYLQHRERRAELHVGDSKLREAHYLILISKKKDGAETCW